jgi:hypothetical protein
VERALGSLIGRWCLRCLVLASHVHRLASDAVVLIVLNVPFRSRTANAIPIEMDSTDHVFSGCD